MKNQKGQTLVEYILLLAVAASLAMTFYRSKVFRRLFGENGEIGKKVKMRNEFAYRHAFQVSKGGTVSDIPRENKNINEHPSYGPGRFFGPKDPYGN